ncbi:tyrosine-type recombinase/integrase [Roseivivax marinus]|uniref:tyrosine-type recombinase/integrase n=1 Tax=Roseivivax marinus TaxID=1379903 RepID=UPI00273EF70D|nr:tyrosine-type recombinase/integrase [Roseivivax marinus]
MKTSSKQPKTPEPLTTIACTFAEFIAGQGYSSDLVRKYGDSAHAFWQHLEQEHLAIYDLDDPTATQIISGCVTKVRSGDRTHAKYRLERFRDYLIENAGAPGRGPSSLDTSRRARLRREYEAYLHEERGLADSTIYHCIRYYDLFLTYMFGSALGDLDEITPEDVVSFILERRRAGAAPREKTVPSHLRNLFVFLFWSGQTKRNLGRSIPPSRQPKPTAIPRYLPPEDIQRLIEAARVTPNTGRRNYAMLLLLSRLGLRSPEVVAIQLNDIDWRRGEILIRGKRQLHDRMPLTDEVGRAIVDYIQNERRGSDRALFVLSRAPYSRFKNGQIVNLILKNVYDATGIAPPQSYIGSHILRHSLATDLLRKGASLEEIGDVLRHRSQMSTTIYAQHDVEALRGLAQPWPIEGDVR